LIEEFAEITGVPVVLNTSFNVTGEAIVENPRQAIRDFSSTGLDYLALDDYLITK
jgi:carbamoyltransferase